MEPGCSRSCPPDSTRPACAGDAVNRVESGTSRNQVSSLDSIAQAKPGHRATVDSINPADVVSALINGAKRLQQRKRVARLPFVSDRAAANSLHATDRKHEVISPAWGCCAPREPVDCKGLFSAYAGILFITTASRPDAVPDKLS